MIQNRSPIVLLAALVAAGTLSPSLLRGQATAPDPNVNNDELVKLSPFEVSAIQDHGYAPSETLSGTKVRTPLREIPMNIQVVTSDFIQDIGAFDLQEAMSYTSAVTVNANSYQATVRGFSSDWQLRNGFRYYKRTDTSKVARIETISGPAAVLYGITQPGGILNVITKQPTGKNGGYIRETYSSTNRERVEGEYNYKVNDKVSVLLVGAYDAAESDTDYNNNYLRTLSPTLVWRITDKTKLTVDYEWVDYDHHFTSGYLTYNNVPIQQPVSEGGFGIPESFNYEGPGSYYHEDYETLFATLEHTFNANASARLTYNSHHQTSKQEYMSVAVVKAPAGSGLPVNDMAIRGTWRNFTLENDMQSIAADGLLRFDTGPVKHQLLVGGQVGVDKFNSPRYYDQVAGTSQLRYRYWSLSDLTPNLEKPSDINYVFQTALSSSSRREENTVASIYATHQGRFFNDRVVTLAGAFYSDIDNYIRAFGGEEQRYAASKVSPQAGIVVKVADPISLYGLYATSLYPQPGGARGGFGEIFGPVKGKSFEYGLKFDALESNLTGTVSIYDIRQEGRVIFDPTAPNSDNPTADPNLPRGANVPTGETSSKGLDLNVYYRITKDLQLIGSYAYNDTEILSDTQAYLVGRKVTPFFRNRAALWAKYSPEQVKGLSVGVGGTWHGEGIRGYSASSASGVPNTQKAEFNAQAMVSYMRKFNGYPTTFAINARNLLRSETVVGGIGDVGYYYGTPREVRFSVMVGF
ncbi:MAG TPA: TonB-dependent receptor plug domain-containing protein [Opitutaceae bacterium]|nr:TonB-dependent receptor plug domain-containing protein [Opitutaceae bacterium]